MFKKYITLDNEQYSVSFFSIWKKLNWDNTYTQITEKNIAWRVAPSFKKTLRLCNICRGIIWVLLFALFMYLVTEFELLFETNNNLIFVFLNIVIISTPIIFFEFLLLKFTPLEIKDLDSISTED